MDLEQSQAQNDTVPQSGAQMEKLIHLALTVRLIHMQNGERSGPELACTYDIHPRGARLLSARDVRVGDLVTVERGRLRSVCRVVWKGASDSDLRGQFTVECVESGRVAWEDELRQMEENYLPIATHVFQKRPVMNSFGRMDRNRRRGPRFRVQGEADLLQMSGGGSVEGRLEQISECGCLISAKDLLSTGTSLRLTLNMCDVSVALRGHVRSTSDNRAMGVEFQDIRQGDRPLLEYVLTQLKKPRQEDFADLEVLTEHAEAAG